MTDPFVDVRLGNARIAKTSVIDNDLNPVWNEKFRIEVAACSLDLTTLLLTDRKHQVCHRADILEFDVRDKDHAMTEEIGKVTMSISSTAPLQSYHCP